MSSDTGIYTLKTPKGNDFEYRVAYMQAFDNLEWDDDAINPNNGSKGWYNANPDNTIKNAREMFKDVKVFTIEKEALEESFRINAEDCGGFTEYGICLVEIDREF